MSSFHFKTDPIPDLLPDGVTLWPRCKRAGCGEKLPPRRQGGVPHRKRVHCSLECSNAHAKQRADERGTVEQPRHPRVLLEVPRETYEKVWKRASAERLGIKEWLLRLVEESV